METNDGNVGRFQEYGFLAVKYAAVLPVVNNPVDSRISSTLVSELISKLFSACDHV